MTILFCVLCIEFDFESSRHERTNDLALDFEFSQIEINN